MIRKPQPKTQDGHALDSKLQELLQPQEVRRALEISLDQCIFEQWSLQQEAPRNPYRRLDVRELIRLCRTLTTQERKALHALLEGASRAQVARQHGVSPARVSALLKRAYAKLRVYGEVMVRRQQAKLENDIREAYLETTRQVGYRPPMHCPRGRERCRRTGVCPYASR